MVRAGARAFPEQQLGRAKAAMVTHPRSAGFEPRASTFRGACPFRHGAEGARRRSRRAWQEASPIGPHARGGVGSLPCRQRRTRESRAGDCCWQAHNQHCQVLSDDGVFGHRHRPRQRGSGRDDSRHSARHVWLQHQSAGDRRGFPCDSCKPRPRRRGRCRLRPTATATIAASFARCCRTCSETA